MSAIHTSKFKCGARSYDESDTFSAATTSDDEKVKLSNVCHQVRYTRTSTIVRLCAPNSRPPFFHLFSKRDLFPIPRS